MTGKLQPTLSPQLPLRSNFAIGFALQIDSDFSRSDLGSRSTV
ncbi:hypothetical protein [Azospirillum palustre]